MKPDTFTAKLILLVPAVSVAGLIMLIFVLLMKISRLETESKSQSDRQCNHCKEQFESLVTMKLNDWASAEVCEKCCQEYRALEARFSAWKDINNK
jgi:hypothetical protein